MFLRNGPIAPSLTGGSRMRLELNQLEWRIVNDGVMGGLSHSRLDIHDDHLRFYGDLSTENRGGFVSVLGRLEQTLSDLAGFEGEMSGDGRRYQLRLRETDSARDVAWRAFFTTRNRPSRMRVALDDFSPVMRGQPAIGARPLALTPVHFLGFMLTSRRPGPFELKIHSLDALFLNQAD